jgi:sugar transferase (PEP-CTERM system associated)
MDVCNSKPQLTSRHVDKDLHTASINTDPPSLPVLDEDDFHEMLYMEKKRAIRSGKPFLLMLISFSKLSGLHKRTGTLGDVSRVLAEVTRETDVRGWYVDNTILGMILTELGNADIETVKLRISSKIHSCLLNTLGLEQSEAIKIYFQPVSEGKDQHSPFNIPIRRAPRVHCSFEGKRSACSMSKMWRQRWFLVLSDSIVITLALIVSVLFCLGGCININKLWTVHLSTIFSYQISIYIVGLYEAKRTSGTNLDLWRILLAVTLVAGSNALLLYLFAPFEYGESLLSIDALLTWCMLTLWRYSYSALLKIVSPAKEGILIVGAGESGKAVYDIMNAPYSPYEVKGFLDDDPEKQIKAMDTPRVVGCTDKLLELSSTLGATTAVLAIPRNRSSFIDRTILEARLQGIEIMEVPMVYEQISGRVPARYIEDQWLLFSEGFSLLSKGYVQRLKRLIDFCVSMFLLVASAPIMALAALAIMIETGKPIFYRQERVGKGSKVFQVLKFRSMHVNAEKNGAVWAENHDSRVTKTGRWIRLFRIDELPQIWNVLRGDMSLVGPRPERPEFVRDLETQIPYYSVRHAVCPGITGWAQVNYSYASSIEDSLCKLEYDLFYIKNMSLLLDLKILLRTIGVVLLREGAR